ncbi:GGDEF domain-containing protein [Methylophilus aquaticus]|uniref:diguanylate cyclase n=1 Tax=Methylophilus aquaticus TaxID=1971610 RepID=A0ABT9JSI8_9PROT|nr:GGDEF domain-containing protein [Methylophilus aquaticus]MDP8567514.1 GGDEF domain-containing protein [Methylophilus aquaticus]
MQYQVTKEKSAEYLRLAVNHMTQQDAAFHPVSYAVWYEYASGEHAKLIEEVDALIEKEKKLNEKSTTRLFQHHIAKIDDAGAQAIIDRFSQVMTDISSSTSKAGEDTTQFKNALQSWSDKIQQRDHTSDLNLQAILNQTLNMQGSINNLQSKLETSAEEMVRLKDEITKARQEAISDGLTGLINRKGFDAALGQCLSSYELQLDNLQKPPCLLLADIDYFKKINDSYGHLFGDKVIKAVAQILQSAGAAHQTAARYGGEEFVLLLPETSLEIAEKIAEDIRKKVEKITIKNSVSQAQISNITISLGVTPYLHGESPESFISRADQALYASKAKGRNQVTVISKTMSA